MSIQYLYDSNGNWIAFRKQQNVFDPQGNWIGWLPWGDDDVVTTSGEYLGTIFSGGRLYKVIGKRYRGYPGHPECPDYPGYPGRPEFPGFSPPPVGTENAKIPQES